MKDLAYYAGKDIRLLADNGKWYEGNVDCWIPAEDNVPEEVESLVLDIPGERGGVEFRKWEIVDIQEV